MNEDLDKLSADLELNESQRKALEGVKKAREFDELRENISLTIALTKNLTTFSKVIVKVGPIGRIIASAFDLTLMSAVFARNYLRHRKTLGTREILKMFSDIHKDLLPRLAVGIPTIGLMIAAIVIAPLAPLMIAVTAGLGAIAKGANVYIAYRKQRAFQKDLAKFNHDNKETELKAVNKIMKGLGRSKFPSLTELKQEQQNSNLDPSVRSAIENYLEIHEERQQKQKEVNEAKSEVRESAIECGLGLGIFIGAGMFAIAGLVPAAAFLALPALAIGIAAAAAGVFYGLGKFIKNKFFGKKEKLEGGDEEVEQMQVEPIPEPTPHESETDIMRPLLSSDDKEREQQLNEIREEIEEHHRETEEDLSSEKDEESFSEEEVTTAGSTDANRIMPTPNVPQEKAATEKSDEGETGGESEGGAVEENNVIEDADEPDVAPKDPDEPDVAPKDTDEPDVAPKDPGEEEDEDEEGSESPHGPS